MVKDQMQAAQILDMMNTAIEAVEELGYLLLNNKGKIYEQLVEDLQCLFSTIENIASTLKEEEPELSLPAAVTSIIISLKRIYEYGKNRPEFAVHKIEFELLPLIESMRLNFYYWGMLYPDKNKIKKFEDEEIPFYMRNVYLESAEAEGGKYNYDLSIIVVAYNKLEYTKLCVQSILEHMPKDIRCELILMNNGSNDETKRYFESVHPNKQLDIAINGGGSGSICERIVEGKYLLFVSNDVIVTEHAIENLYKCISSDDKIGWAVPSTPNVSNLQTIPLVYNSLSELQTVAASNNIADPYRHEQRTRLCNPIDIKRVKVFFEAKINGKLLPGQFFSFPDDHISLLLRRNRYKLMLVKDAYCYHFGSVTLKDEVEQHNTAKLYLIGRKNFAKQYGIDPWGKGLCYEPYLFQNIKFEKGGHVNILGVDCGMGSNPLKIKESLKENSHNLDVTLYNYTSEINYAEDLKGTSDIVRTTLKGKFPPKMDKGIYFDYIIIESDLETKDFHNCIISYERKLADNGMMIVACHSDNLKKWAEQNLKNLKIIGWAEQRAWWLCWTK